MSVSKLGVLMAGLCRPVSANPQSTNMMFDFNCGLSSGKATQCNKAQHYANHALLVNAESYSVICPTAYIMYNLCNVISCDLLLLYIMVIYS